MYYLLFSIVWVLAVVVPVGAQQEMRSATKGSSTPLPITGTSIDANHNGLDVNVVGGTISGSGGTQYDEDTAHVSGDKLTMAGVVQKTADAALAADGDNTVLQVDSNGYLKVNIKAGAGSGGTAMTDDAAFTPGTTSITPAGFLFDDVSPDSVNEGDGGVARMSANRNIYTTLRDAAGNERGANVNASNELLTNANTELPAAAALADDTSNPTVPGVGAFSMCWDGTNWDRCAKGTGGNGSVDANTQRVTIASDSTGVIGATQSGTWNIGSITTLPALPANQSVNVAQMNGVTVTMGNGSSGTGVQRVTLADNSTGIIAAIGTSVTPGTSAAHLGKAEDAAHGSGDTGVMLLGVRAASPTDRSAGSTDDDYEPVGINGAGAVWMTPTPTTVGGLTTHYITSAASTNSTNVKNAAGQVYLIRAVNTTATLYYLRLYNASSAPTCSSATNFVETIPIPASTTGAGIVIPQYMGQAYSTGIGYCLTGGGSSTDNTNAATGVYLTILYK